MSDIFARHFKWHVDERGCTTGATITVHFARRDMIEHYVKACKADPKTVDVYVSEDMTICEVVFQSGMGDLL